MSLRVQKRKIIEKYFEFTYDQAKCKLCSQKLKNNRIFNLKVHIFKVHKITDEELRGNMKNEYGADVAEKKVKKKTIKIEVCKKELIRSYIGLVTEDSLPFEFLDSENFTNFIDPICLGVSAKFGQRFRLNSSNCKQVLKSVSEKVIIDVRDNLYQKLLSLNVDSANGLSRNIFGISVQFLNKGEIQSHILGLAELSGTGAVASRNFATEILNALTKYDINLKQIVSITSDSGANIIKSSKILSHCSIFEDGYEGQDLDEGNEAYLKNIQLYEDTSVIDVGDIKITRYMAYAAQLCILDVSRDPEIINFLFSCRNFVKFLRNPSNGFREIFEMQNLTVPQIDCPTKWGSTYSMIESTKYAKNILVKIEPVENKSIDENFVIDDNFWNFVEAYCITFEPLQLAIVKYQEEQLHYGNFYAEWLKCKLCTEKILQNCSNTNVQLIAKILLQSLEKRTAELLSNESLLACLFLDPRFNHTLTLTKKLQAMDYLKKIYERIKTTNVHTEQIKTEEITIAPSSSQMEVVEFSQKADEYLNEYLTRNFVPNSNDGLDVASKLENLQMPFLRVDSNVLQFWADKQCTDPELYALSNVCFAIPANQVTMEHTFSTLKNIFEDTRNNRNILEDILTVKQNPSYLDKAVENALLFEDD